MHRTRDEAGSLFRQVDLLEVVDSTNDYLKGFLGQGEPRIAVAHEQTAGRGRYHRKWHSPPGQGLYLSYLVYPRWNTETSPLINMVTTLAVVEAIQEIGPPQALLQIKLPNDVLLGGRKVAGTLIELSSQENRLVWAIVGIGVNLYHTEFPPEIGDKATSLRLEGVAVEDPMEFCRTMTRHFERLLWTVEEDQQDSLRLAFESLVLEDGAYS